MTTAALPGTSVAPSPPSTLAESSAEASGAVVGDHLLRWRSWVTEHRVGSSVLAGLVAVHIATITGFFMPGIGLPKLDWNTANGLIYRPTSSANVQFLAGGVMHYMDGVAFAVLYALGLHPLLSRFIRSTSVGNLLKGVLFGLLLATISAAFMAPRVYYPDLHIGFFSHRLGWQTVFAIYLWHVVYGLHLGLIYNPRDDRERLHLHKS
ncbi:hypothetical protein ACFVWG_20980 [Kribbella sp. NPDC058245]|uniref:hypothetical protein n=1 Tax=Kribbella sp. NPDC058245 TaxID=3346399 RepID=UPI0036EDA44F